MTNAEIKKAWNTFKRQAKKECPELCDYTFVMNAKQIVQRTATICLGISDDNDFSDERDRFESYLHDKQDFEYVIKCIDKIDKDIKKYGTRENMARQILLNIANSKAFSNFNDSLGGKASVALEINRIGYSNYYYARFSY